MEAVIWLTLAVLVVIAIATVTFLRRGIQSQAVAADVSGGQQQEEAEEADVVRPVTRHRDLSSRLRARRRNADRGGEDDGDDQVDAPDGESDGNDDEVSQLLGRVGTKKMKRIQEKADRKAMKEQEEAMREDRKKREVLREEERQREEEQRRMEQEKKEDELQKLKEEQERKEQEEYLKLKESFVIEETGEMQEENESENLLQEFIDYIKRTKVVFLEDLASQFSMRTQDAIARVSSLQESGQLTGVVDDRGKFIYISREELDSVAKFIRQRGRVSIAELVSSSNTLINLQPEPPVVH